MPATVSHLSPDDFVFPGWLQGPWGTTYFSSQFLGKGDALGQCDTVSGKSKDAGERQRGF